MNELKKLFMKEYDENLTAEEFEKKIIAVQKCVKDVSDIIMEQDFTQMPKVDYHKFLSRNVNVKSVEELSLLQKPEALKTLGDIQNPRRA